MIGRSQVPIPSQPSQAVAPRGAEADPNIELLMNAARTDQIAFPNPLTPGIAQAGRMDPNPFGGADRVATQAQGLMDTQPDYKRTHELLDEYDKGRSAHKALQESGNAIMQQLANLGGGDTGSPVGADGGLITRMLTLKSRNRYANTQAQRLQLSGQVEALKFAEGLHQTGNADLLAEIAKYQGLGGDWKDLFKSITGDEQKSKSDDRLWAGLDIKAERNDTLENQGQQRINIQDKIANTSQSLSGKQLEVYNAKLREMELGFAINQATGMNLAEAKVLSVQANPAIKYNNMQSAFEASTGRFGQPRVPVPGFQSPPPPPTAKQLSSGAPQSMQVGNVPGTKGMVNPPAATKIGTSTGYADVKSFPGLVEKGNVDLSKRQIVDNPDGSYGTEFSMSFNDGKYEVLIPTIFDGKHHTEEQAIQHYRKTGEHMGKFASGDIKNIEGYSERLHKRTISHNGKPYRNMQSALEASTGRFGQPRVPVPGFQSPPPPPIPGEMTPLGQAKLDAADASTALKKTQIAAAVGEKMTKDRKRAMRFASDGMGLSFWEKHNELWDVLPPEKKYEMLSKWKAGGK